MEITGSFQVVEVSQLLSEGTRIRLRLLPTGNIFDDVPFDYRSTGDIEINVSAEVGKQFAVGEIYNVNFTKDSS